MTFVGNRQFWVYRSDVTYAAKQYLKWTRTLVHFKNIADFNLARCSRHSASYSSTNLLFLLLSLLLAN